MLDLVWYSLGVKKTHPILKKYFKERAKKAGLKGGPARAKKLTAEQLTEIGKAGAAKRWKGHKKHPK